MEALGGAETVKGMGIERPVRLKWETKYAKALEVQYRAQSFNITVGLAGQLLNAATTIAILWVGADLVLTREPLSYPADRDLRLQNLARADEGFLLALGYSTQRGYGRTHPFAGEIRFLSDRLTFDSPLATRE